eukprot:8717420-Pyramimonas_sp.AAC.1
MLAVTHDCIWERRYAEGAVDMATSGSVGSACNLLSIAWARFAMQAAERLGHLTESKIRSHSYGGNLRPT